MTGSSVVAACICVCMVIAALLSVVTAAAATTADSVIAPFRWLLLAVLLDLSRLYRARPWFYTARVCGLVAFLFLSRKTGSVSSFVMS